MEDGQIMKSTGVSAHNDQSFSMTFKEIAETLGISEAWAKRLYDSAMEKIASALDESVVPCEDDFAWRP